MESIVIINSSNGERYTLSVSVSKLGKTQPYEALIVTGESEVDSSWHRASRDFGNRPDEDVSHFSLEYSGHTYAVKSVVSNMWSNGPKLGYEVSTGDYLKLYQLIRSI